MAHQNPQVIRAQFEVRMGIAGCFGFDQGVAELIALVFFLEDLGSSAALAMDEGVFWRKSSCLSLFLRLAFAPAFFPDLLCFCLPGC